jgi:lambda family phage portal protein
MGIFTRKKAPAAQPVRSAVSEPVLSASNVPKVARRPMPRNGRVLKRLFDAGVSDRLTSSWATQPLSADEVVSRNQRALVARSREQTANNDYMKAFLRKCRQNIVGPRGVQMQAQSKDAKGFLDTDVNEAIEAAWAEWSMRENCDVTGRRSLWNIQRLAVSTAAQDGEFMIRMIFGRDAGPWGFSLQMLDPQRCPVDYNDSDLSGGRFIRQGIEFNRFGRPLAYLYVAARSDAVAYSYGGRDYTRVPASEIIHGFVEELVEQKRGLPWAATSLWRLQMLGGFEKAALVNARAGAAKGGWLEWEEGFGPDPDEDGEDEVDFLAEPGVWQELPPGLRAKTNDPQYPTGEFSQFHKSMLRGASAGMGVAYNNLAHDLEGVSYSSIRQGTLDEREYWKELQEWLVEALLGPVFAAWLPRALLSQRIKVKGKPLAPETLAAHSTVSWQPRRWDWIDPNADVKAAVSSKDNLFASPGQIIRDRGRDPRAVWREVARDIEDMKKAGIPDSVIEAAMGQQVAVASGAGSEGNKGADDEDE